MKTKTVQKKELEPKFVCWGEKRAWLKRSTLNDGNFNTNPTAQLFVK